MTDDAALKVVVLSDRLDQPGAGLYAANLAQLVSQLGHEVFLIATELPWGGLASPLEVPVRLCRHLKAWGVGGMMRKWLMSELRVFNPDILHATVPQLGSVGREIARKLDIPSIVTVHGEEMGETALTAADLRGSSIIAASQTAREDLVNHLRIPKSRISVIYPGVAARPGHLAEPADDGRTTVAGTLGALQYLEGHRLLLQAARHVLDRGLDLQVLVAGVGPEKANLRELTAELELHAAVTFVEDVSLPRSIIDVMDIFVLPTMHKGMSPMVLEAMALGKPVVVSGAGGIFAAVQNNHTGLVFSKGDVQGLVAALVRLMLKPDFAARMAREGRELVRREFSLETMVRTTLHRYRRLVAEGSAANDKRPVQTSVESG